MRSDHRTTPILTRYGMLWALVLAAFAYAAIFHYTLTLTGSVRLDGVIGVILGLYICSHPTANFLDLFLFSGRSAPKFASWWSALLWFAFNVLVMAAGWSDIFIGATKLAASGP
jgi:hypothetical protein